MSWFSRIREFVEEEDAKADDLDAEFDHIAEAFNGALVNPSIYRTLRTGFGCLAAEAAAGDWVARMANVTEMAPSSGITFARFIDAFNLVPGDLAVEGKTTKLRLKLVMETANTAPGSNFIGFMAKFTRTGITGALGTKVIEVPAITTPAANTYTFKASDDVTVPAEGLYCFGVATNAKLGAAPINLMYELQARNV